MPQIIVMEDFELRILAFLFTYHLPVILDHTS